MGNTQISKTLWLGGAAHGSFTENNVFSEKEKITGKDSGIFLALGTGEPAGSKTYTTTDRPCSNLT